MATTQMRWADWRGQVDQLCERHLKCSWADMAGDIEPLRRAFDQGETPLDFVKGHAAEYGLDWFHEDGRPWDVGARLPTPEDELRAALLDGWRSAAHKLGEALAPDGPVGYYAMTPDQWLAWALETLKERRREVER